MTFLKTHKIEILVGLLTSFAFEMLVVLWNKGSAWGIEILRESYYLTLASMSTLELVAGLMSAFLGVLLGIFSSLIELFVRKVLLSRKGKKTIYFQNVESHQKLLIGFFIVGTVACILTFALYTVYILMPAALYGKYQKNLIEIRPYITEDEYNRVQSKWVQIKEKDDYEEICKWIENVKQKNELE